MPNKPKNGKGKPVSATEKPSKNKDDQVVKKRKRGLFSFKATNGEWYRLTPKQKLFCDYFLQSLNGVQSALKVYGTKDYKTASNIASENLDKPNITAYLTIQFMKFNITPNEVMGHLSFLTRQSKDLSAKGRGIDMSLKVFGKYPVQKYEVEHGVNEKLEKFLEKQNKKLP